MRRERRSHSRWQVEHTAQLQCAHNTSKEMQTSTNSASTLTKDTQTTGKEDEGSQNEEDGEYLIRRIGNTKFDDELLRLEWAHDSIPAMLAEATKVTLELYPNLVFYQHPRLGTFRYTTWKPTLTYQRQCGPPSPANVVTVADAPSLLPTRRRRRRRRPRRRCPPRPATAR